MGNQQQFNKEFNQFSGPNQGNNQIIQFNRERFPGNNINRPSNFFTNRYGNRQQQSQNFNQFNQELNRGLYNNVEGNRQFSFNRNSQNQHSRYSPYTPYQ